MPFSERRKVTHVTDYDYQQPAECSQQICILQPQEGEGMEAGPLRKGQRLISHTLKIRPNPSTVQSNTDAFGNVVHHFLFHFGRGLVQGGFQLFKWVFVFLCHLFEGIIDFQ